MIFKEFFSGKEFQKVLAEVGELAIMRALKQGPQTHLLSVRPGSRVDPSGLEMLLLKLLSKPEKSSKKELAKRDWRHIMRVLLGVTGTVIETEKDVVFKRFSVSKKSAKSTCFSRLDV
ncbi:hypothetical protein [Microbulbifer sp. ALW1]|uniref:hypothetical protein n=1 Tax=Microbulbifer sp. (strain ALW1) TaxID=1516059 RepID=UPI0013574E98|nr:hypothetical protein [Microbulbifer sp. ALW1]